MSEEDLFYTPGSIFNREKVDPFYDPDKPILQAAKPRSMLLDASEGTEVNECKGIIARANVSQGFRPYTNANVNGFYFRLYLNILKKKSCPGCKKCGWFWDCCSEVNLEDFPIEGFEGVENGKLYRIDGCGSPPSSSPNGDDEGEFYLCVKPYSEE